MSFLNGCGFCVYYKLDFSYLNQNIALSITDQKEFFYVKVKKNYECKQQLQLKELQTIYLKKEVWRSMKKELDVND